MTSTQSKEQITGSLKDWPLESIIDSLAQTSRSGLLRIEDSEIWFYNGTIYLVRTPRSPSLSSVLFNAEVGPLNEIKDRFSSEAEEGYVLEQLIQIYPKAASQLKLLLREYNLSGLFELLVPTDGNFVIEPDREHKLGHMLAVDAIEIIAQSKQRIAIWKKIANAIPSVGSIFVMNDSLPNGNVERVVSSEEWRYLSKINGVNSVADVVDKTNDSPFRVTSTLYRLMLEGLIVQKQ